MMDTPGPVEALPEASRGFAAGRTLEQRQRRFGYLAITPALLVLLAILPFPIGASIWLSLQRVSLAAGVFAQDFVGTDNYADLVQNDDFQSALLRSAYFSFVEVVAVVGLGLGVALLLNHPLGRPGIFRVMLIIPWAIAPVANAVLWKWIFNANYGILNAGLIRNRAHRLLYHLAGDAHPRPEHAAGGRCLEIGAFHRPAAAGRAAEDPVHALSCRKARRCQRLAAVPLRHLAVRFERH